MVAARFRAEFRLAPPGWECGVVMKTELPNYWGEPERAPH